jgi:hypothetical protein
MFWRSETADGSPRWMASLRLWWDRDLHDVAWAACPAITEAAGYLDDFRESDLDPRNGQVSVSTEGALGLNYPRGPGAEIAYYQPCCTESRFSQWASRAAETIAPCFGPWRGYMP